MCMWCLERPAEGAISPQTGVRDVVSFHVCWNPQPGPLPGQPVLLPSVELHLCLIYCAFHYNLGTNYIPELRLIFMMRGTEAEGSLYFWWFCFLTSNLGEKLPCSSIKEKNLRIALENVDSMGPCTQGVLEPSLWIPTRHLRTERGGWSAHLLCKVKLRSLGALGSGGACL